MQPIPLQDLPPTNDATARTNSTITQTLPSSSNCNTTYTCTHDPSLPHTTHKITYSLPWYPSHTPRDLPEDTVLSLPGVPDHTVQLTFNRARPRGSDLCYWGAMGVGVLGLVGMASWLTYRVVSEHSSRVEEQRLNTALKGALDRARDQCPTCDIPDVSVYRRRRSVPVDEVEGDRSHGVVTRLSKWDGSERDTFTLEDGDELAESVLRRSDSEIDNGSEPGNTSAARENIKIPRPFAA